MNSQSSSSLWETEPVFSNQSPLRHNLRADVCIVGAGIAGLTTAYLLARRGKSVIVLDAAIPGGGQTGLTTAHLSNAIDDRYVELERMHGTPSARLAAQSHTVAIARIEEIVRNENIACDFERLDGYLFLSPEEQPELLDRELEAALRAGLSDVGKMDQVPFQHFHTGPCLRFPGQGQFHPLKYLAGLAHVLLGQGGSLFTQTRITQVTGGSPARVETDTGFAITADAVVVATNTPVNDRFVLHTKLAAYRTYVVAAPVPRGSVPKALYWDTQDPYHYVRLTPAPRSEVEQEFLIVGGEDHKTGQGDPSSTRYQRLEAWARERFPMMGQVAYRWSGQVMETLDGLAYLGKNPGDEPNVYVATGDSGMGMTHGTIAGMLLSDVICGQENPWTELYAPSRKTFRAVGEFVRENLNVAAQYKDWFSGSEVKSPSDIPRGTGAVLRRGLSKVAVYRDEDGSVHECSAVCPHLNAIVRWNGVEKTWDCPAHGSRFEPLGRVIQGPANSNLSASPSPADNQPHSSAEEELQQARG